MVMVLCAWANRSITYLEKAGHFVIAGDYRSVRLRLYLFPLVIIVRDVPSTQSRLSLPVLQEDEPYLRDRRQASQIRPHQSNHTLCICLPLSVSRVCVDRRLRAYSTESVVFLSC